jgi:hypothetical protein
MLDGLCRSAANCGELVECWFCLCNLAGFDAGGVEIFCSTWNNSASSPSWDKGKNSFETWQILSAGIRGAKTPQKAAISPQIHHQKTMFCALFLQKPLKKQGFTGAISYQEIYMPLFKTVFIRS